MNKISKGDNIYYTGDMANQGGWCKVEEVKANDILMSFPDGHLGHVCPMAIGDRYEGHCNPRFVTEFAKLAYHMGLNK